MPKNLFSIIDRMSADSPGRASRITYHFLRFTFYVLRAGHHATRNTLPTAIFALAITTTILRADDKITYTDHILPLVEANCSKCHNADKKKADLDLTSYQGALKGSASGAVLASGDVEGSKLWKAITHSEEPFMPPNRPALADKELDLFQKWIQGGLLETAGGKAIAAQKPAVDLSLKDSAVDEPAGPPPMPQNFPALAVGRSGE